MIKPTMPRTGSYAPSAPRGSSSVHRRAMGTALLELGVEIAVVAVAVYASYRLSVRIWSCREL